jgi:hypothetical protein
MTLIEVLIAMVVLAFIVLQLYQATAKIWEIRAALIDEGEFYNGIRMAMGIVERDVSMIYNPALILPEKKGAPTPAEQAELEQILNGEEGRATAFWSPAVDKTGVRPSHFIGTDQKLSFVAVSHVRMYRESRESEFAKVTYELQDDRSEGAPAGSRMLVKTENANAFDDDERLSDKNRQSYPLLRGITRFRYRYYRKTKDEWVNSWDSDNADFRDQYPDIIEITLEVRGPSRLLFEGLYKMRPEIPLRGLDPST